MITPTHAIAAALVVASLALAVFPAAAVDGEILINQAGVNAGGITPGDTAGFPATLSRPGRYKLTSNLVVPSGADGIILTANNVTIDLNGFTIRSNPPGSTQSGIWSLGGGDGLRVMNGTMTGFGSWAILTAPSGTSTVVQNMRLLDNFGGAAVGANARILGNIIANSILNGVSCAARCVIEQNVVTGNGTDPGGTAGGRAGVSIAQGGAMLRANVIVGNGSWGLVSELNNPPTGYGQNMLVGNNGGGGQVAGDVVQMHPNACDPACP